MPTIDDIYGRMDFPTSDNTYDQSRTPEVVTPPPAVITPGQALVRFLADPAGLKHDALRLLDNKVQAVETVEAASSLSDKIAQAATLVKNIEARKLQHTEALKKEANAIDAEAKRWRDPVNAWIDRAKKVVLAFNKLQAERATREEEARQEAMREAAKRQNQAAIMGNTAAVDAASVEIMRHEAAEVAQPITGFKTEAGTLSTRKTWKVEVINPEEVPDAYLVPDPKKLQAAVDAGARQIEGCHIEEVETLTVRTRG